MEPMQARRAIAYLRMGLGALWPTPAVGAKVFGVDADAEPSFRLMARLFAIRDLALGAALLQADEEEGDRLVDLGIVVDAADLVAIVLAGARRQVGARMVLLGGTTAATAVGLGLMARRVNS